MRTAISSTSMRHYGQFAADPGSDWSDSTFGPKNAEPQGAMRFLGLAEVPSVRLELTLDGF